MFGFAQLDGIGEAYNYLDLISAQNGMKPHISGHGARASRIVDPFGTVSSVNIEGQTDEHEAATIKAFVVRSKQERFLSFLCNPKNRGKFTLELSHFEWFDQRFVTSVPWKVDPTLNLWERHTHGIENVSRLLRSRGAGQTCGAISEDPNLDGRELDLDSALADLVGRGMGTILSCVPGKLAFFEGESDSRLLAR
jgi:hypothetical protein